MYVRFGKRAFDIICSLAGLLITSPLFLAAAVTVKLSSRGSMFFVQQRMGINGNLFSVIKFRTMTCDEGKEKLHFEPGNTKRITAVGSVLRKTKIDELPQLINVFKGDMSFVGPRPEVLKYREFYSGEFEKVLSVRPGITDNASIKYRNEEKLLAESKEPEKLYREAILPDKLRINLDYVQKDMNLTNDLAVILKTLFRIFA